MSILSEREKTHGCYAVTARIAQSLRSMFRGEPSWASMSDGQRESFDMMAVKMARILSGQASFQDHWVDISGYAELGVRDCQPEQPA